MIKTFKVPLTGDIASTDEIWSDFHMKARAGATVEPPSLSDLAALVGRPATNDCTSRWQIAERDVDVGIVVHLVIETDDTAWLNDLETAMSVDVQGQERRRRNPKEIRTALNMKVLKMP